LGRVAAAFAVAAATLVGAVETMKSVRSMALALIT